MKKRELPVISVLLYIAAAITGLFTLIYAYYVLTDIVDSVFSGLVSVQDNIIPVAIYCMTEFGVFIIYTLLLVGLGSSISHSATAIAAKSSRIGGDNGNALDELFPGTFTEKRYGQPNEADDSQ